ncbi:MAG: hypothetical protein JNM66_20695 [Bryobacterales bacterium]|nr:hypothetical protein [Bryobacterales bacterium]
MSPQTARSHEPGVSAPETLGALQNAWTATAAPSAPAPSPAPARPEAEPRRLPLRDSFLSLRDISQLPLDSVRDAFPMMSSAFPAEWKEQVRQLRNRLTQAQADLHSDNETLQVIAFTNMDCQRPRYGTAANIALAMASIQDTRVLVIDANLSAPSLHAAMRVPAAPGLCEATRADRIALPPCFHRVAGSQVYLQTIGDLTTFPMDPLDLRGLHNVLRELRTQFDWIFIDGPGFDTPADAMAITMAADGVIMMIESEHDSFRAVARALSHVQGRRMLGAVMF